MTANFAALCVVRCCKPKSWLSTSSRSDLKQVRTQPIYQGISPSICLLRMIAQQNFSPPQ